jgi:thioredoxin 1
VASSFRTRIQEPEPFFILEAMRLRLVLTAAVIFTAATCFGEGPNFPPLEAWRTAVLHGDSAAVKAMYSSTPPARIEVESTEVEADADAAFWTGLKARTINLKIAQSTSPQPGVQQIVFQAEIRPTGPGRTLYISEGQLWQQQGSSWKLIAAKRTDATRLEQPLSVDAKIYPGSDAHEEIRAALAHAAKSGKRVLVVFGADWCFDCHVLDKAFKRQDIAAVLNPNYELVHIDVGRGEKNQDLMNEYQVPMKRGIPAIALLDSRGKLLYSQKNGEWERARALGPEDLLEFLKKWKPQAR